MENERHRGREKVKRTKGMERKQEKRKKLKIWKEKVKK